MDAARTDPMQATLDVPSAVPRRSAPAAIPTEVNSRARFGGALTPLRAIAMSASVVVSTGVVSTGVAAADQKECLAIGGNVQSGNICRIYDETPNYSSDLRFRTDYPDGAAVVDFVMQTRDQFVRAAQSPGAQGLPYQLTIRPDSYQSGQPTRSYGELGQPWHGTKTLALRINRSMDPKILLGTKFKTFTFDFDHNRPVTFDNLFAPGTNPIASIYPAVKIELERQQLDRKFKLAPASVWQDPSRYQNFAITDDAVTFFFGTGELPIATDVGPLFAPVSRANLPPLQL
jgi:hypothetical protein